MDVFTSICLLICGVGIFLIGMFLMENGLSLAASAKIKTFFNKINSNPLKAYGLGAGTTMVLQSSSATSVMSMGFVEINFMTYKQAAAFVLGARFGTTITGILVSFSTFSITPIFMALAFFGICMMLFFKKPIIKNIGTVIAGFGTLFAGIQLMSDAISRHGELSDFFISMFQTIDLPLLLITIGALFTGIIQSSSATNGLLITLLMSGTLDISQAIFLSIGATIGTCVTGLLACIGTRKEARKVALFNIFTAIVGAVVVGTPICVFKKGTLYLLSRIASSQVWQLSFFSAGYGFISSVVCLIALSPLCRIVSLLTEKTSE